MSDRAPHSKPAAPDAMALSGADIDRLLNDHTPQLRLEMSSKLTHAYNGATFDGSQAEVAEQIFRLLARDTEVKVRAALAEQIKQSGQIPRDIVMTMAKDVEEVALPVLSCSEVLTDKDLLQIIASSQAPSKQIAISKRSTVSDTVAGALVETGNAEVVGSLMDNKGAQLGDDTLYKVVQNFAGEQGVMSAMAARAQLPPAVAEKLVAHVSGSLADALKKKYNMAGQHISEQVEKTREATTSGIIRHSMTDDELDMLTRSLMAGKRLTPSLILATLCQGNWRFFNMALAKLAGIPPENANVLLLDHAGMGFKALYKKSGLTDAMFDPVRVLYRSVRELHHEGIIPQKPGFSSALVARMLERVEGEDMENVSYLLALVRKAGGQSA